jgi:hypothetical protein
MCLVSWSICGLVKDKDIFAVMSKIEVEGEKENISEGWDSIVPMLS